MTNDISLRFNSASFKYADKTVFSNISFTLKPSEILYISGKCGCGKTTLSKLACGFYIPSSGDVIVLNQNTKSENKSFISSIGYVSQNPKMQFVCPDVQSDIAFGLENLKIRKDQAKKRINEVLSKLGILHLKSKRCHLLSGGEAQLVALAGALVKEPKLLILDEPFEMCDKKNKEIIEDLIEEELKKNTSILCITHDVKFLKKVDNFLDLS